MNSLFNYSTLKVSLEKEHKMIRIALDRPQQQNAINMEMLFELETLFNWVAQHIEIQTILLTSDHSMFSIGWDPADLCQSNIEKIKKLTSKLQNLVHTIFHLPQTIVVDLREKTCGAGIELAACADIRIAHENSQIQFDHLENGHIPCSGGIGFIGSFIPKNHLKNWILSGLPIDHKELLSSGFVFKGYAPENYNRTIGSLLSQLSRQSQVARIQAKKSLFEATQNSIRDSLETDGPNGLAAMSTYDWKEAAQSKLEQRKKNFKNQKEFGKLLRLNFNRSRVTPIDS